MRELPEVIEDGDHDRTRCQRRVDRGCDPSSAAASSLLGRRRARGWRIGHGHRYRAVKTHVRYRWPRPRATAVTLVVAVQRDD